MSSQLALSSSRPSSSSAPSTVTNFTFNSLIEQNNLSDDSCLVVVSHKVYDLTLWLQSSLEHDYQQQLEGPLLDLPQRPPTPSTPTSQTIPFNNNNNNSSQSDLVRLLSSSKTDPLGAGELFKVIFERQRGFQPLSSATSSSRTEFNLDDWLQEYRIGDYCPRSGPALVSPIELQPPSLPFGFESLDHAPYQSLTPPSICPSPPSLPLQHPDHQPHLSSSIDPCYQFPDSDCPTSLPAPTESAQIYSPRTPTGPSHLSRAMALVDRLKLEVVNAQRGVGMASLSLNDAWIQLAYAEKVRDHLVMQACEGFRPIWHEWETE